MRILQVRFKNLNSLVGEWEIDLAHPAFTSDGIFAITGPTGAGKTTILDAVCLALYGQTPRLNRITKSGNEIMSRQTGECFAEVTFETQAGRFRCHWSQHRARRKPDSELQPPKHEIANADSGEIFESKIRGVADQIETATGMDFDRFTRSMLLAQGGFAAFLQAAPDERAPILEQITGTKIYSEISIRIHERQREERDKLNLLQAETSGIVLLEPEKEKEVQQEFEAGQKEETALSGKMADVGKAIAWLTTIDELKSQIGSLSEEAAGLQSDMEAFESERAKLDRATKAATLDGVYATLTAIRKQQADDEKALQSEKKTLPGLESSVRKQAEVLKSAEQQTLEAKEEQKDAAPLIQKIRLLDQKLVEQEKAVSEGKESCKKDAAKIDAEKQAAAEARGKRGDAEKALKVADSYLEEHARDEWLISGLAGIEEQLSSLLTKQKEAVRKEDDYRSAERALEQAAERLADCIKQCGIRKQEIEEASKNLRQEKIRLSEILGDRLLREYRTEKETLLREMTFFAKIAELEEHRTKLEDGRPCPLCGAKEHPFAEGNVPVPDKTEKKIEALTKLIKKAEDQESAIKELEQVEAAARKNLTDSEKLEAVATGDEKAAGKTRNELKESLGRIQADFLDLKQTVSGRLQPLGITEIPDDDVSPLLESLRARLKEWQAQVKIKADIEKQIAAFDSELKRLDAVIETQSSALGEKRDRLAALEKEHAAGYDERKKIYGDKKPETEESRLNRKIFDAERVEKEARTHHGELHQKLMSAKASADSLERRIGQRSIELKKVEVDFVANLGPAGFEGEKQFLEARLAAEQREALFMRAKELDERHMNLKARQKDREARLTVELAKKVTDKTLEELGPYYKELEESLKQLRDAVAALKHRLVENAAARKRVKEKQAAIEARKKECRRWENLHVLIGSADGKKYRNFAQGLTFEMMIGHANRQLQKMTDRYLLLRDDDQPLELNVIDNYQAGEIRSTKNLSGGESFIVSLSLALGLSHMASRNVRIDSLFLDEGFGSLDEEALDTALETLAGLRQDGKLIGVISHVNALKERISTRIQVTPRAGGRSIIDGPGCRRREA